MGASSPILDDDFDPADGFNDDPPVLCRDCDHVHPTTRKDAPYHWRCMKAPEEPLGGFQDPDWRPSPPWHLCRHVNPDGYCGFFAPRRTPKEATDDR
jgi:hypothetical protein